MINKIVFLISLIILCNTAFAETFVFETKNMKFSKKKSNLSSKGKAISSDKDK